MMVSDDGKTVCGKSCLEKNDCFDAQLRKMQKPKLDIATNPRAAQFSVLIVQYREV
jgi:hypothetical protein